MALYKEGVRLNLQSSILLAQKLPIAEATIESGKQWSADMVKKRPAGGLFMISTDTFVGWCELFGRRIS